MADVQVTQEGFGERVCSAASGVCVGIALFFLSFIVLGWNEGRYVHTAYDISHAKTNTVTLDCKTLDSSLASNQGKLVYLSCPPDLTAAEVTDPYFNIVSKNSLYITRTSQICQNVVRSETKNNRVGGGKTTTCVRSGSPQFYDNLQSFSSECSTFATSSSVQSAYKNSFGTKTIYAKGFKLGTNGSYANVPDTMLAGLRGVSADSSSSSGSCPAASKCSNAGVACDSMSLANAPAPPGGFQKNGNQYCTGNCLCSSSQDAINGNTKVSFQEFKPKVSTFSTLSGVSGSNLAVYTAKKGTTFNWIQEGDATLDTITTCMRDENIAVLWALRVIGFLMMWIGLALPLQAPAVLLNIIPCVGGMLDSLIENVICCITCPIAAALSLLVIAIAWLLFRPVIGAIMLLVVGAIGGGVYYFAKNKKDKQQNDGQPVVSPNASNPGYPQPGKQDFAPAYPQPQPGVQPGYVPQPGAGYAPQPGVQPGHAPQNYPVAQPVQPGAYNNESV